MVFVLFLHCFILNMKKERGREQCTFIYVSGKVKQISELHVGILTQCIKVDTVRKILNSDLHNTTVKNILSKINSKLNGINHEFNNMWVNKILLLPYYFINFLFIIFSFIKLFDNLRYQLIFFTGQYVYRLIPIVCLSVPM